MGGDALRRERRRDPARPLGKGGAAHYKIDTWGTVRRTTHAVFVDEIKRHVAAGDPVLIGIPVYTDFNTLSEPNPIYDCTRRSESEPFAA